VSGTSRAVMIMRTSLIGAKRTFLRGFSDFCHGIPCADWLRTVMSRIDPDLFAACFSAWVAECWPSGPIL
jgi:DDE_Tnp_1-associated